MKRSSFDAEFKPRKLFGCVLTPRLLAAFLFFTATLSASPMLVYLGTYTQTTSRGIYVRVSIPTREAFRRRNWPPRART